MINKAAFNRGHNKPNMNLRKIVLIKKIVNNLDILHLNSATLFPMPQDKLFKMKFKAIWSLLKQDIDCPPKNMYRPQEKGKVRERLATNVTIVFVTLIQFISSRGVIQIHARPF